MDAHYASITLLRCPRCGQVWLRYHFETEAFTASGRWYLGALPADLAARITPESAKAALESLGWYFYGGSYYHGVTGKTSGAIWLNP